MRFQIVLPMPLKSLILLDFARSICLLEIYLAMKFKESMMFLESEAKYSRNLWREIEWKLSSHRLSSVGLLGSYSSWILMILSSLSTRESFEVLGALKTRLLIKIHCSIVLSLRSATLLTWLFYSFSIA